MVISMIIFLTKQTIALENNPYQFLNIKKDLILYKKNLRLNDEKYS